MSKQKKGSKAPKTPAAEADPETTRAPDSETSPETPPKPKAKAAPKPAKTISRQGMELVLDRYASQVGTGRAMTGVDFEAMRKELSKL